jgi:hypothetical protein
MAEMVVNFWEQVEQCRRLDTSSSRICGPVLGLANDRFNLAILLQEATGRLQAMQDEHHALSNSVARVWDLVLKRSGEASSLAMSLSSMADLIEGRVDVAAASGVH